MTGLKRIAASALLSCVVAFTVNAQKGKSQARTLFTINNKPVSTEEFTYLYRKNHQNKPDEFTKEKIEEYLNLFINYKLKVEEAMYRGMDTTAKFREEYQTYRDELLKPYLPDTQVIDSLVKLTYDRMTEEVNASHILIKLAPDATPEDTLEAFRKISEVRMHAAAGEDFAALAARYSEEPGAESSKGNLGYFTAMQMVFPFEQAAYQTPVGDISMPLRTQFGYHILKVNDRQPSRGEVEVSHIMIRSDGRDDLEARNRIFDIHDKLQKGMAWEELCRQYSEDPNSKESGGKLRPFGVGAMASVPQFQDMAFSLQEAGEISDPVQTQFGWHILRLEQKIPLPSFEELKPALTQRVSRDERVRISKEALRKKMQARFNYRQNAEGKARLLENASEILDSLPDSGTLGQEVLFTMRDKPYRIYDLMTYLESVPERSPSVPADQFLTQQLTAFEDRVQLDLMEEDVKAESPDYKWLLKEYYEGILLFEIMEKEVWNKAMEDSTGQRNYFDAHASDYQAGERIAGKIFSAASPTPLEELKELLSDENAALSDFMRQNRIRMDSGAFEKSERTVLTKIAWAPGVYSAEHSGVHYLVEVEEILPPGPETFEEARASVISDYQTFIEDSWISELKRKFGVKVDKRAKKRAFAQLMDN